LKRLTKMYFIYSIIIGQCRVSHNISH